MLYPMKIADYQLLATTMLYPMKIAAYQLLATTIWSSKNSDADILK
jgi:hypothetical protein